MRFKKANRANPSGMIKEERLRMYEEREEKEKRNARMKSNLPNAADGARDQGGSLIGCPPGPGKTPTRWSRDPRCPLFSGLVPSQPLFVLEAARAMNQGYCAGKTILSPGYGVVQSQMGGNQTVLRVILIIQH